MSKLISSVVVTLSPKQEYSSEPLVSQVLQLDYAAGCTIPQAAHYVSKNPLINRYFSKYDIVSLTFKYFEL